MIVLAITGVVKTVLILIGVFFILRLLGRVMIAKRNMEEEKKMKRFEQQKQKARKSHLKNEGKVKILKSKSSSDDDQYVDFEIIDE